MVRIRGIGGSKPGFGDIITRSSADARDTFHGLLHIFQRPSCRLVEKAPVLSTVDDNESLVTQFRTPQFLLKVPYQAGPKACATVSLGNWSNPGGEEGILRIPSGYWQDPTSESVCRTCLVFNLNGT